MKESLVQNLINNCSSLLQTNELEMHSSVPVDGEISVNNETLQSGNKELYVCANDSEAIVNSELWKFIDKEQCYFENIEDKVYVPQTSLAPFCQ